MGGGPGEVLTATGVSSGVAWATMPTPVAATGIATYHYYICAQQTGLIGPGNSGYMHTTASVFKGGGGGNYYDQQGGAQSNNNENFLRQQIDGYVMPYDGSILAITASQTTAANNNPPRLLDTWPRIRPVINGTPVNGAPQLSGSGSGAGITHDAVPSGTASFVRGSGLQVLLDAPFVVVRDDMQVSIIVEYQL